MIVNTRKFFIYFSILVLIASSVIIYQQFDHQNTVIEELTEFSHYQEMQIADLESKLTVTKEKLSKEIVIKEEFEKELLILKKISRSNYAVVGIDSQGNGVVIPLEVTVKNGNGSLFLDVTNILFDETLQSSVQISIQTASEISNTDLRTKDIMISMDAPMGSRNTEIAGGSGGAAMTIAIIAAMEEYNLSQDVLITGTIERRHIIGEVGFVKEKAIAAKEEGANVFIVPPGQRERVIGLDVVEALTIEEAWDYIIHTAKT
jgi:PDZ domain-containing secreted protein